MNMPPIERSSVEERKVGVERSLAPVEVVVGSVEEPVEIPVQEQVEQVEEETQDVTALVAEVSSILQVEDVPVTIPESVESAMDEPTLVISDE